MKRLSFVLALVLVLSLSVGAFAGNWIDGTYEGYSDAGARASSMLRSILKMVKS